MVAERTRHVLDGSPCFVHGHAWRVFVEPSGGTLLALGEVLDSDNRAGNVEGKEGCE